MLIFLYFALFLLFAILFSSSFPFWYAREKQNVIAQSEILCEEKTEAKRFPGLAIIFFLIPVFIFFNTENITLAMFVFVLAIVAYTDLSARWIPDFLSYLLIFLAMVAMRTNDLFSVLCAVILYLTPVIILSSYGYLRKRESWVASGDYYVLPSIGLTLLPEYAAFLMLINLLVVIIVSKVMRDIPLVTIAYITFSGYQTCVLLGLF